MRDLTGDGTSDVVWYNASTGRVDLWKIANGQRAGSVDVGPHPLGWQPVGYGDLNGDGTSDLLWHNPSTGNVDLWKLLNGQWAGSVDIGPHPLGYQVAGIADFDLDGTSDVLWYNPSTGHVDLWKISNGHWAGSIDIGPHPLGWQPIGIGDFNHDGTERCRLVQFHVAQHRHLADRERPLELPAPTSARIPPDGRPPASATSIMMGPTTSPGTIRQRATSTSGRS